ncbi:hypothetical protein [Patulibacter americanus]|uniref:hypothetical protein n=1 Tax=Patulibacter americanus TaxID=588672 RepID=UPI0003B3C613|nr:hypothetical protein [Patulibacter americanus]
MTLRSLGRPRAVGLAPFLVAGALLAGCGSDAPSGESASVTAAPPATTAPTAPETAPPGPGAMPPGHGPRGGLPALEQVPRRAEGAADPAARRVAEEWFARVRRGDDVGAAALMADGTRYVNGAILVLRNRTARVAAAAGLPCGALPIEIGGAAGGYVVLSMRLTAKAGAGSCDGEGSAVSVAIHVKTGDGPARIDDWVRVDPGSAPDPGTPV